MALMRMTSGNIPRQLAAYAVPLVLGNLFQLTYNVVDSAIVGRFIGKEALAAVGTASPVMNLLILGVSGLCIGASVIMSEAFGARDDGKVRREMATVSVFGFWFSAVCAAPVSYTHLLGVCVLRVAWVLIFVPAHRSLVMLFVSYPISWSLTSVLFVFYYLRFQKRQTLREQACLLYTSRCV